MKYRYILTYQATDSETTATRTCFPLHGDDLSISIDRESDEWYYTRNLDGKLVFVRDDYAWIMAQEFDGTFTLDIRESHDNGANWFDYFSGTFSRASLEIDEDNRTATLNGLKESIEDLIKNGAKEDYDLMKLIPDSYAKEVQGQVPPALAMVDYRQENISKSDIFCGSAITGNGYKSNKPTGWNEHAKVEDDGSWRLINIYGEAKVTMPDSTSLANGMYCGRMYYHTLRVDYPSGEHTYETNIIGLLTNNNNYHIEFFFTLDSSYTIRYYTVLSDDDSNPIASTYINLVYAINSFSSLNFNINNIKIEIIFHYIRATLLTQSGGNADNVLDTGDYYKRMKFFNNSEGLLQTTITNHTVEQPNGHRMVPGSDEYGGIPQYFAPPDDTGEWIPLAEDNWNFASMWYKIQPSVTNGLSDPDKYGSFAWTRCWTIGCCIQHLLDRITDGKVVFAESPDYSQFLYGNPNPVEGHEPFQWLVTQKSNVMHPAAAGASRCPVRLDWFLELLRNAFNCYYWFERHNDGRYDFRIEHVEYFRRGGAYQGDLADQLDLTRLKPYRNFLRHNQPAKRYADQTNKYTFDLDGMVEKYTYSWQGDGGGDDFKGNPMYFRAGWIEKGSSDDRQVDNIFADLGWLMLNAGTDTASSKNYDGLFIFGGYQALNPEEWRENSAPLDERLTLATDTMIDIDCDVWLTIPSGQIVSLELKDTSSATPATVLTQYTGTGEVQTLNISYADTFNDDHALRLYFGNDYADVIIHRIHARSGNVFYVPNIRNLLRTNIVNYLQNGCLAWPWLQCEYLHYDIPAAKWTYLKDEYTDNPDFVWETDGTIKMVKKQTLAVVPVPDASTEDAIMGIMGVKTGLGTGIIDNAKINLASRNAEMTIIYDINPQNQ